DLSHTLQMLLHAVAGQLRVLPFDGLQNRDVLLVVLLAPAIYLHDGSLFALEEPGEYVLYLGQHYIMGGHGNLPVKAHVDGVQKVVVIQVLACLLQVRLHRLKLFVGALARGQLAGGRLDGHPGLDQIDHELPRRDAPEDGIGDEEDVAPLPHIDAGSMLDLEHAYDFQLFKGLSDGGLTHAEALRQLGNGRQAITRLKRSRSDTLGDVLGRIIDERGPHYRLKTVRHVLKN